MTKAGDDLGGAAARRAAKRSAWASRSRSKRLRFASKTLRSGRMWAHRRIRPKRSRTACLADRTASCARSSCHRPSSRTPTAAPRRQYLAESADSSIQRLRAVTKARASSGGIAVPRASSTQIAIRCADQALGTPSRHASSRSATVSGWLGDGSGPGSGRTSRSGAGASACPSRSLPEAQPAPPPAW